MKATISLIDLVNALETTGPHLAWRVDLVTGDVVHCDDDEGTTNGRYRRLPADGALREGEVRRNFCATLRDEDLQARLSATVDSPSFVNHARSAHVLDDFLVHRRAHLAEVALEWAAAEEVDCRRDLSPASLSAN